jgi:hypothetical protein
MDRRLQVSALQALTGTVPSTDVIDLGAQLRLIGPGDPLWWIIAARTGLNGGTIDITVQTDDNSGFASPATVVAHPQLAAAAFVTGARFVIPMFFSNERFLRLNYVLGANTATVDAWLTNQDPTLWIAQPDAI